ncbi:hypothetical protein [Nocardia sp. NPDC055049]
MNEHISNATRSLDLEDGDQVRRNLEHNLRFDAELCDSGTAARLRSIVDHLEVAVQICSREGIPLPVVLDEVEAALAAMPHEVPADRQAGLRLHLVDYVTAAFAKGHLGSHS